MDDKLKSIIQEKEKKEETFEYVEHLFFLTFFFIDALIIITSILGFSLYLNKLSLNQAIIVFSLAFIPFSLSILVIQIKTVFFLKRKKRERKKDLEMINRFFQESKK